MTTIDELEAETLSDFDGDSVIAETPTATTAGGGKLSISTTDGVKVGTASGSATVVKTDITAKNGLIHVIDSVLLP